MTTKADISLVVVNLLKPLVSNRVYRNVFPQAPVTPIWPSIRYSFPSVTPNQDLCGDGGEQTSDYRLQIDVVMLESSGPTAFGVLVSQVKSAMAALQPIYVIDSEFEEYDSETKTTRASLDYLIYLSSPT